MPQSHKVRVEAARKARDKASGAIYALARSPFHTFSQIMEYAPKTLKDRLYAAETRLITAEHDAIAAGKAWRASFGMLTWYR